MTGFDRGMTEFLLPVSLFWWAIRGLLLAALACIGLRWGGRRASAATRHMMIATTLIALIALLPLSLGLPVWRVACLPESVSPPAAPAPRFTAHIQPLSPRRSVQAAPHNPTDPATASPGAARQPETAQTGEVSPAHLLPLALCGLWLAGVCLMTVRLLNGLWRLRRWARGCHSRPEGALVERVCILLHQSELCLPVRVRQAVDPGCVVPMTWGTLRPILLLPANAVLSEWPEGRLEAVVRHELAHIARQDWLTHTLAQLACALHWFNPLVWQLARQMQREAELACDDGVLLAGIPATDYAAHLVEMARLMRSARQGALAGGAQGMAQAGSDIQARLEAILAVGHRRAPLSRRVAILLPAAMAALLLPLAVLRPVARAAERPAARAQVPPLKSDHPHPADVDTLLQQSTELSWRAEYEADAKLAEQVLQNPAATARQRADAHWLLFESAWWRSDKVAMERHFQEFVKFARKHPEIPEIKINWDIAKRYHADPLPGTASDEQILATAAAVMGNEGWGDGLHYARLLTRRKSASADAKCMAWLIIYIAARQMQFEDTRELAQREFARELPRVPQPRRKTLADAMSQQKQQVATRSSGNANPVSGMIWAEIKQMRPLNLDFAQGLAPWQKSGGNGEDTSYHIEVDPTVGPRPGIGSVLLTPPAQPKPDEDGAVVQKCRADTLRGKRIRFSAAVKTGAGTRSATLFLHLDAPDQALVWNMMDRPVRGETDWKRYEFVVDVPANSQGLMFGAVFAGPGTMRVADFRFEEVGKEIPVTPPDNHFLIDKATGRVTER